MCDDLDTVLTGENRLELFMSCISLTAPVQKKQTSDTVLDDQLCLGWGRFIL